MPLLHDINPWLIHIPLGTGQWAAHKLFFQPFPKLLRLYGEDAFAHIQALQDKGEFTAAGLIAREIIALALEGLSYYDTYDRTKLRFLVSTGYLSFMVYCLLYVSEKYGVHKDQKSRGGSPVVRQTLFDIVGIFLGAMALIVFCYEGTPWHAVYSAFPIYFMTTIAQDLWSKRSRIVFGSASTWLKRVIQVTLYGAALFAMAVSFFPSTHCPKTALN